ncbi:phosphatase PAP2 family protein [bacterium]|nr:phosphatase PAP2 family protein [bacterium]
MQDILFGTGLIEALQNALSPTFDRLFVFFTELGGDFAYLALIGIAYWCWNKRGAVIAFLVLLMSAYLHHSLKQIVRMERPPPEYRIIGKETITWGFPSGHTQNAATFWSWVWLKIRGSWCFALSLTMIFLVGFSRIYLGVHYPGDVIGGIVIGVLFSISALKLGQVVGKRLKNPYQLLNQVAPILALSLLFLNLLIFPDIARGDPSPTLGFLFGFPIGVMLEMKYINFSTDVSLGTKILRALMGFSLLAGLMIILPLLGLGGTYYLRFIRSAMIAFAGAFLVPLLFKAIKR